MSSITIRPDLFRDLMQSILSYDWSCDRKVTVAYVNLLGHILSANVTYLVPAYNSLIASLIRFAELDTQGKNHMITYIRGSGSWWKHSSI